MQLLECEVRVAHPPRSISTLREYDGWAEGLLLSHYGQMRGNIGCDGGGHLSPARMTVQETFDDAHSFYGKKGLPFLKRHLAG